MAYTVSRVQTVFGNEGIVHMTVTADSASATIETGLKSVVAFSYGVVSANSANFKIYANSGTAGTAIAGVINFTGMTSGDKLYVTVYGPR